MKKSHYELIKKRILQTFILLCCIGFPLEVMPNKILFSLLAGTVLIYIVDIIYDVKTLNERLDNTILIGRIMVVEDIEYKLKYLKSLETIKNQNLQYEGKNIAKIFKAGGMEFMAIYTAI